MEETKTKVDLNHLQVIKKLKNRQTTVIQIFNNQKVKISLQPTEDL
jgi:hypothetical protein